MTIVGECVGGFYLLDISVEDNEPKLFKVKYENEDFDL